MTPQIVKMFYAATAQADPPTLAERALAVSQHFSKKARFFPQRGSGDGFDSPAIIYWQTRVPSFSAFKFDGNFIPASVDYAAKYSPAEFKRLCELLTAFCERKDAGSLKLSLWVAGKTKKTEQGACECWSCLDVGDSIKLSASASTGLKSFFDATPLGRDVSFEPDASSPGNLVGSIRAMNWQATNSGMGWEHFSTPNLDEALKVFSAGIDATFDKKLQLDLTATLLFETCEAHRVVLNELQQNWKTTVERCHYARSPWERPQTVDPLEPPRFPVVGYKEKRAIFQLDVVHASTGSFLEIAANSEDLRQQVAEVIGLPVVNWGGEPHHRWQQSHGVDPQTPKITPAKAVDSPTTATTSKPRKKSTAKKTVAPTDVKSLNDQWVEVIHNERKRKPTEFSFNGNHLETLPSEIGTLSCLETLSARRCGLKDLPEELTQLQELTALEIDDNPIETLPEVIHRLTKLRELSLSGCRLTELPAWIGELQKLQSLSLNRNCLTRLNPDVSRLCGMRRLQLAANKLTELPDGISALTSLTILVLSENQLRALPERLGDLTQLTDLSLVSNQLTSLPSSMRQLTRLQYLRLDGNQLTELPEWIGSLTALERLTVENNRLQKLPKSLRKLPRLQRLHLHGNTELGIPDEVLGGPMESLNKTGTAAPTPASILDYYFASHG